MFNLLDYESCLEQLKTEAKTDRMALSYAFRPLTKNGYVSKREDGCVSILTKGRELFPGLEPLVSAGGGEAERKRVMAVSRMAMWMEEHGFPPLGELPNGPGIFFIPSACWRKIAPGILSTTRFVGMLVGCWWDAGKSWQSMTLGTDIWNGRYGRRGHYFIRSMEAMRQGPQGCSWSAKRTSGMRWRRTSSGRPCGAGSSFCLSGAQNGIGLPDGLDPPLS